MLEIPVKHQSIPNNHNYDYNDNDDNNDNNDNYK